MILTNTTVILTPLMDMVIYYVMQMPVEPADIKKPAGHAPAGVDLSAHMPMCRSFTPLLSGRLSSGTVATLFQRQKEWFPS